VLAAIAAIGAVELVFFAANAMKLADGGWFPLACASVIFTLLTTWKRAEGVVTAREGKIRVRWTLPRDLEPDMPRVEGTAIYLSPTEVRCRRCCCTPEAQQGVHQRVVFLTIVDADVPRIADVERRVCA